MINLFLRKLASFGGLTPDDEAAVLRAASDVRSVGAREMIVEQGDAPTHAHAILEGFGCRYKLLPDGTRQILDFLVPGDLCDGHSLFLAKMDHSVGSLSPCRLAYIPNRALLELTETHARLARALWWSAMVQESVAREWMVNIGRRTGLLRIGHLLCELCLRLNAVGLAPEDQYSLPITQTDLADATGLSVVHTNRMLQKLRSAGLIALRSEVLTIPSVARLQAFCGFDEAYLHLRPDRFLEPLKLVR